MSIKYERMTRDEMQAMTKNMSAQELKDKYNEYKKNAPLQYVFKDKYQYEYRDLEGGKERVYYFEDGTKQITNKRKGNTKQIEELAKKASQRVADGEVQMTWAIPFSEWILTDEQTKKLEENRPKIPVIMGKKVIKPGTNKKKKEEEEEKTETKTSQSGSDFPTTYVLVVGGIIIIGAGLYFYSSK